MTQETQQQKDAESARLITLLVSIGQMWNLFGEQAAIGLTLYLFVGAVIGTSAARMVRGLCIHRTELPTQVCCNY